MQGSVFCVDGATDLTLRTLIAVVLDRTLPNAPSSCAIVNILLPMQWMSAILKKGWCLTVSFFLFYCSSFGQIRYSNFYDLNEGAGGLLSVTETPSGQFVAVGSSLNLSSNKWL